MNKYRLFSLIFLLGMGIALTWNLYQKKTQPPLKSTLAPSFQLIGKSTLSITRALSKVIPIDDLDEQKYGEAIALNYQSMMDSNDVNFIYLNNIIQSLAQYAKRPFNYRVYVLSYPFANAFALPGGIILVTNGLLNTMDSEAEIASVLAHEMGHIEREHCLNAVKYELLLRKLKSPTLGKLADFAMNLLLRHSFSKTQENEADEYAYKMILHTKYIPTAVSNAFRNLKLLAENDPASLAEEQHANITRDYFMTHPPLPLRIAKFREQAKMWWQKHPNEKRYIGKLNLLKRTCFCKTIYQDEWAHLKSLSIN